LDCVEDNPCELTAGTEPLVFFGSSWY
jgi:hypothetical protein